MKDLMKGEGRPNLHD